MDSVLYVPVCRRTWTVSSLSLHVEGHDGQCLLCLCVQEDMMNIVLCVFVCRTTQWTLSSLSVCVGGHGGRCPLCLCVQEYMMMH